MDILQSIGPDEQLIARGEYNYQVAGQDSGLLELWSLHQLPGQAIIHRAAVNGQIAAMRLKQITHFVMAPDYQPRELAMTQDIDGRVARSVIHCFEQTIEQSIATEDTDIITTLDVPLGYRVFFPPVSAQGFILHSYDLSAGGRQPIPLVSIRIQPEEALPLSAELRTIEFERLDSNEEIETPAGQFACHHFIRYDQHMKQHLWLDEVMTPIQWSVPYSTIMKWEYLLTRYHRER